MNGIKKRIQFIGFGRCCRLMDEFTNWLKNLIMNLKLFQIIQILLFLCLDIQIINNYPKNIKLFIILEKVVEWVVEVRVLQE